MVVSKNILSLKDFFWIVGILSFPFYFFGSGGVQISTIFLLIAALVEISKIDFKAESYILVKNRALPLFFFIVYAFLITLTWLIIIKDNSILIFPVIYIFDFFIFFALCYRLVRDEKFVIIFSYVIFFSAVFQFILSFLFVSDGVRGTLFFNNPNQLGYFSLLTAALLTILAKKKYMGTICYVIGMLCCIWLAQLSLSKSAMVSGIFLLLYSFLINIRAQFFLFILLVCFLFFIGDNSFLLDRFDIVQARLEGIGSDSDDNAVGRGYDRIWLQPEILLLGGAEGAVYRWDTVLHSHEMHSTWGTILFSYGFFGLICWLYFLVKVGLDNKSVTLIPLLSIFAYGITHNGLRFVYFWFFMAILVFISVSSRKKIVE